MKEVLDVKQCALLVQEGRLEEAEAQCEKLLKAQPESADALCVLGTVKYYQKKYSAARDLLQRAWRLNSKLTDAKNIIGLTYLDGDRNVAEAIRHFNEIVEADPNYLNAWVNLGNAHATHRDYTQAERFYKKALELDPNNFIVLNNLGSLLVNSGKRPEGIEYYYKALALRPEDSDLLGNLTNFLMLERRRDEVYALVPRILRLKSKGVAAFTTYNFCKFMALWEEEAELLPVILKLIAAENVEIAAFESTNLALLASPDVSSDKLFEIHKCAARTLDRMRTAPPFDIPANPQVRPGKLRIGYLSPDFRAHSVNNFLRGIVNAHDRERFEIYCYSSVAPEEQDEVTAQYRSVVDRFIDVNPLSDEALAQRIRDDGIHILVDLAGYTFRSRIGALCYRPAPVSLSYIGYPYTSGLETIDYFVANELLDGPNNQRYFTERQLHLPESPFTFDSLNIQPLAPDTPFERNGCITFGTLNNPYKYSRQLIRLWSRVLKRLPTSRFIVNHPSCSFPRARENILRAFVDEGIAAERITIIHEKHSSGSHLHYYNDIDISLDTFPLTGGTTTVDAIWMGVPVVTQVGDLYYQRLSYSFLNNTGTDVSDLCAFSEEDYVEKAVALAGNRARLLQLRHDLPRSLRRSVLRDSLRLTRHIEQAYVEAWNRKFPDARWSFPGTAPEDLALTTPLPDGLTAVIRHPESDNDSYVMNEHHGWYDPEYRFALSLVQPGMSAIDIGAALGAYALPMARRTGDSGRVWVATRFPHEAKLIEASCRRNGITNLAFIARGDRKVFLDDDASELGFQDVCLVRIDPVLCGQSLFECAESFFSRQSPVVMFGSKSVRSYAKQEDAEPFFRKLGYGIYRYVPGLDLLVPVSDDETLDTMAINAFACKPETAERLSRAGLLARAQQPLQDLPPPSDNAWRAYLEQFAYGKALSPIWPSAGDQWDDIYKIALNLYVRAQSGAALPEVRFAAFHAATSMMASLIQVAPTFCRRMSLVRMLIDAGRRTDAVTLLSALFEQINTGASFSVNEPFLALSPRIAQVSPGERLGDWAAAAVLEQLETQRAFSSWFTGEDSLQRLQILSGTGFQGEAMERRYRMLAARLEYLRREDSIS